MVSKTLFGRGLKKIGLFARLKVSNVFEYRICVIRTNIRFENLAWLHEKCLVEFSCVDSLCAFVFVFACVFAIKVRSFLR